MLTYSLPFLLHKYPVSLLFLSYSVCATMFHPMAHVLFTHMNTHTCSIKRLWSFPLAGPYVHNMPTLWCCKHNCWSWVMESLFPMFNGTHRNRVETWWPHATQNDLMRTAEILICAISPITSVLLLPSCWTFYLELQIELWLSLRVYL